MPQTPCAPAPYPIAGVDLKLRPAPARKHGSSMLAWPQREGKAVLEHRLAVDRNLITRRIKAGRPAAGRSLLSGEQQRLRLMALEPVGHVLDQNAAVGRADRQLLHVTGLEADAAHKGDDG